MELKSEQAREYLERLRDNLNSENYTIDKETLNRIIQLMAYYLEHSPIGQFAVISYNDLYNLIFCLLLKAIRCSPPSHHNNLYRIFLYS